MGGKRWEGAVIGGWEGGNRRVGGGYGESIWKCVDVRGLPYDGMLPWNPFLQGVR